ncbi:competence pheromone ComX [Paenibacillus agri]|uniref:ComX pheromone n=1 Tax=Paenibacillus agri TaxID=2744309 RepID=A0A850EI82_9BACL|nr:competence pheromone ComX [Paenibacillus agri]NUU59124.1 competence pheromone ComX [Paenibacillus agri]
MLKELIQSLMADPSSWTLLKNGQLQLAGISEVEHRALIDVLGSSEDKNQPMRATYWF